MQSLQLLQSEETDNEECVSYERTVKQQRKRKLRIIQKLMSISKIKLNKKVFGVKYSEIL